MAACGNSRVFRMLSELQSRLERRGWGSNLLLVESATCARRIQLTVRSFHLHGRFPIIVLLGWLAAVTPVAADDPPAEDPIWPQKCTERWYPQDPNCGAPDFTSRCFNGGYWFDGPVPFAGYPMNFALWHGPTSPSLPPISLDPAQSTLALVARGVPFFQGPNPKAQRPLLNGVMDLVTGVPLLREVDFELPFGGAVFRHVRTFADPVSLKSLGGGYGATTIWEHSSWDWNGYLWMMSESPLLLVDAAYPDIGFDPENPTTPLQQYTYLILDAHHTIPFKKQDTAQGTAYVTEPWFDAVLSYEGSDPNSASEFYVWLSRQSIKYTFTIHHEDQWSIPDDPSFICRGVDSHAPPPDGQGIPYYGFLTRIEDRYGNRAEITHAEQTQQTAVVLGTPDPLCDICVQNCNEKGQVHSVRLIPAGTDTAVWTLLYTYRPFSPYEQTFNGDTHWAGNPDLGDPLGDTWRIDPSIWYRFFPTQLHSIHVYSGDVSNSGFVPMLPLTAFYCTPDPNDPEAPLDGDPSQRITSFDAYDGVENGTLPSPEWAIRVNYLYSELDSMWYTSLTGEPNAPYAGSQYALAAAPLDPNIPAIDEVGSTSIRAARLLKATVERRKEDDPPGVSSQTRQTVYRHELTAPGEGKYTGVTHVFYDAALARILKGYEIGAGDPNVTVNDLLATNLRDTVWSYDADSDSAFQLRLGKAADLAMPYAELDGYSWGQLQAIIQEVGLSTILTGPRTVQTRHELIDRRNGLKQYKFAWFVVHDPPDSSWTNEWDGFDNQESESPSASEVYPPYRASYLYRDWDTYHHVVSFRDGCLGNPDDFGTWAFRSPPLDREFYVAVIDEFGPKPDPNTPDPNDPNIPLIAWGHVTRRAVGMNIYGIVVWDETWSIDDPNNIILSSGFRESFEYDQFGRIVEKRTPGWSVASDPNSEGLVYQYVYTGDPNDGTTELAGVGVKWGLGGTPYWLQSYERDANHPEFVTAQYQYHTPSSTLHSTAAADVTRTYYEFDPNDAVTGMTIVRPRVERYVPGQGWLWLYPTEKTAYDERGNETFKGAGSLQDWANPSTGAGEFFITSRTYDDYGNLTQMVVDSSAGEPNEFPRRTLESIGAALNLTSTFEYDPIFGLKKAVYPDGRTTYVVVKHDQNDWEVLHQWIYKDVDPNFVPHSPVEINRIESGRVVNKKKVALESIADPPDGAEPFAPEAIVEEWVAIYDDSGAFRGLQKIAKNFSGDIDDNGDVDQADQGILLAAWGTSSGNPGFVPAADLDGDGTIGQGDLAILLSNYGQTVETLSAAMEYGGGGLLARLQDADSTITRYVYDNFGRLERTFRGTNDDHVFWGTVINSDPNNPYYPNDNMFLVEKRYYGEGVTDANRLITVRSYRDKVTNQYWFSDPNIFGENNEDAIGWLTVYGYDWRMRQVCEQVEEPTDPNVYATTKTTLTWLDNMDRPRLVAEFTGDADLGALDPRAAQPGDDTPFAASILAAADPNAILSLSETVYNGLGLVAEQRTFDVSDDTGASYTATVTQYNHAGQPVRVESPGAPIRQYRYDAKGRQIISRALSDTLEVTRTKTTYDLSDRAIKTEHWERRHDASGARLDTSTGIPTYTYSWYDYAGRVIATANYGTASNDAYKAGASAPAYDPANAPNPAPTGPQVTRTEYDDAGRAIATTHPDGTVTEYQYDDLGRQAMVVENAGGAADEVRRTAYRYDDAGRLWMIAAVLPSHGVALYSSIDWEANNGSLQVTELVYGADVVDTEFAPQSLNHGFIAAVHYPNPTTGQPDETRFLEFTYYADGSVASRTDARGILLRYAYDDQKRLSDVWVDDAAWFGATEPDYAPLHRVAHVMYEYTSDGDLTLVTACDAADAVIAQNAFGCDGYGDLLYDRQQHFGTVSSGSPTTSYDWLLSSAQGGNNVSRLIGITYPDAGTGGREIAFGYGAANSIDDNFSRIAAISDGTGSLAAYQYAGVSRRVSTSLGCGVSTSVAGGGGYDGLDRFGRLLRLHWNDGATPLHRYDYTYDQAGSRLTAKAVQVETSSIPDRSYEYGYDGLRRLVHAKLGELDPNGHVLPSVNTPVPRHTQWLLDNLGNFSGGDPNGGSVILTTDDGTGQPEYTLTHHATSSDNAIQSVTVAPPGGSPATQAFVYDIAGNLVFDGNWLYQYDGLNRLVQVNAAGSLTAGDFNAAGAPADPNDFEPGDLLARYVYDGLGRLIVRQVPLSRGIPDAWAPYVQTEQYYYDGVRRIQMVVTREPNELALVAAATLEPAFLLVAEQDVLEYVWGPEYVDELVCQYDDPNGAPFWALTDANYNVMAIVDGECEVVEQYVYDPYGGLLAVETLDPNTTILNRVAHQGLFFECFADDILSPPLAVGAPGVYENRNRKYEPYLSRFLQKDVNETAQPLLNALALNAERFDALLSAFDLGGQYADGLSLYAFARNSPVVHTDPLGTFSYTELGVTMGVQGFLQGLFAGALNSATGGRFSDGFVGGFVGGALGGAGGFLANSAFAASASGLWGTFLAHSAVGGVDGAVSAFGQTYYSTGDLTSALADALFGGVVGAATGGVADWIVRPIARVIPRGFRPGKLASHFRDHAHEWTPPMPNEGTYLQRAIELLSAPPGNILEQVRPNGDILRYNPVTNEFAVMASDGTIRTLFRPKTGITYWNNQ